MIENGVECKEQWCSIFFSLISTNIYYVLNKFEDECEIIFFYGSGRERIKEIAIYYDEYDTNSIYPWQDDEKSWFVFGIEFVYSSSF